MYNFSNALNSCFGKVASGMCRISMNGDIAIKTSQGYKTYDVETGHLLNCDDFAFELGSDFFFIIPTNKVNKGNIILAGGKPRCVIEAKDNEIKVFRYEDGTINIIVPECHPFMGRNYFYGKIVSIFGNIKSDKCTNKMMKFYMLSQMFDNTDKYNNSTSNFNPMLLMMMGGNIFDNMFEDMFNFDIEEDTEVEEKDK